MAWLGSQEGHWCLTALRFSPLLGCELLQALYTPHLAIGPLGPSGSVPSLGRPFPYSPWARSGFTSGGHSHALTRPVLPPSYLLAGSWSTGPWWAQAVQGLLWGALPQYLGKYQLFPSTCSQLHWGRVLRQGFLGACSAPAALRVGPSSVPPTEGPSCGVSQVLPVTTVYMASL